MFLEQGPQVLCSGELHVLESDGIPQLGSGLEKAYVQLTNTALKFYKSKLDTAFSARDELELRACSAVDFQDDAENGQMYSFCVLDPGGLSLARLGSDSSVDTWRWVCMLLATGCAPTPAVVSKMLAKSTAQEGRQATAGAAPEAAAPVSTQQEEEKKGTDGGSSTAGGVSLSRGPSQGHGKRASAELGGPSQTTGKGGGTSAPGTPRGRGEGEAKPPPRRHLPMTGSSPVHTLSRPSYLSSERMWHEKHTGLINLMAVIVVATNFRLALENGFKYGLRIQAPLRLLNSLTIGNPNIPLALCYPALLVIALLAVFIERCGVWCLQSEDQLRLALSKKMDSPSERSTDGSGSVIDQKLRSRVAANEWALFLANLLNTSLAVVIPWTVIYQTEAEPFSAGMLFMLAIVLWMKLVSYHHCCADLRSARREGQIRPGEEGSPIVPPPSPYPLLRYPENITVKHMAYFLCVPTLCYQINYPRTSCIRKQWLARRVAELVLMLTLLSVLLQQYMMPAIANSMSPIKQMDWLRIFERVLKLSLPNIYVWMVMFYCLFHLWLNILGEILHFGDREFYKDWWNAATVGEYWKLWNMPVHRWLLRHIYFPTLRMGVPRWAAIFTVFFVSAIFHELLLGVPLHLVRLWAFSGIILQVPLVWITESIHKKLKRDEAGNIVFWLTFCVLGQPLSVLLYCHDYMYVGPKSTTTL